MNDPRSYEQKIINQIKMLCADAVQNASSGHPGFPLGTAHIGFTLFHYFLNYNPENPNWINRDRFILSAGHGSTLLYSLLHLYGFNMSLEDIKNFRQWGSKTAGHPEINHDLGIEFTTGPLGQGAAMSVGVAIAERFLRNKFASEVIDHKTVALVSDGDLMEGVSYEAASLAGHQQLDHLYWIYDCNNISIEGSTNVTFTEDIQKRFEAMGWKIFVSEEANVLSLRQVLEKAKRSNKGPKLIIVNTVIGEGAYELEGNAKCHGAPLGKEILKKMRKTFGYPADKSFHIDTDIKRELTNRIEELQNSYQTWLKNKSNWKKDNPKSAKEFSSWQLNKIPSDWFKPLLNDIPEQEATRSTSGFIVNHLGNVLPNLLIGSGDLSPSTKIILKNEKSMQANEPKGRNIQFGIREHAMGAVSNGIAVHSNLLPITSTFLVFSNYMLPSIRLAALQENQTIFVFSHDSFHVGEDGPTHQPIEQTDELRLIPNISVIRPADHNESIAAWDFAINNDLPSAILTSRQKLTYSKNTSHSIQDLGGYYVKKTSQPDLVLYTSGSELSLCLETADLLDEAKISTSVVSIPCFELFSSLKPDQRDELLPSDVLKVGVEASAGLFMRTITPHVISMSSFGASAPENVLSTKYGFTSKAVKDYVLNLLKK